MNLSEPRSRKVHGGAEGSRTPVRKDNCESRYERSSNFWFIRDLTWNGVIPGLSDVFYFAAGQPEKTNSAAGIISSGPGPIGEFRLTGDLSY